MTTSSGPTITEAVPSVAAARDLSGVLVGLVQLTKPAVTRLVMVTMLCGALAAPGAIHVVKLLLALVGTAIVVGAANALNMYLERDIDAQMERTRGRPLPSGRLSPELALGFGVLSGLLGVSLLALCVNLTTASLALLALVSYVFAYTPLKRVTPFALHVGAIPGAIPPLLGWTSVTGSLTVPALAMFALLFVWQIPHFIAIALFRQREYERAGLRVLPAVRGVAAAKSAIVRYSALQLAVSTLPYFLGLAGPLYLWVAVPLGLAFLAFAASGLRESAGPRWARALFFASMPYLVIVFGILVASALSR
jgi:heme o synthase